MAKKWTTKSATKYKITACVQSEKWYSRGKSSWGYFKDANGFETLASVEHDGVNSTLPWEV